MRSHRLVSFLFTAALAAGCLVTARGSGHVVYGEPSPTYVTEAPPPRRSETPPAPKHGYVWIEGFWDWGGSSWTWVSGHWEREQVGSNYVPPRYDDDGGRTVYVRGYWTKPPRDRGEHGNNDTTPPKPPRGGAHDSDRDHDNGHGNDTKPPKPPRGDAHDSDRDHDNGQGNDTKPPKPPKGDAHDSDRDHDNGHGNDDKDHGHDRAPEGDAKDKDRDHGKSDHGSDRAPEGDAKDKDRDHGKSDKDKDPKDRDHR